ncbi:odorant receptor coreceptor [Hetaerina americana]|uniref:odorant receptor coreceptor n=1 Tax=Hetaerina americana TaxID=62018 RepID=UPI003A7F47FF
MGKSVKRVTKKRVGPFLGEDTNLMKPKSSMTLDLSFHVNLMYLAGHFLPDFTTAGLRHSSNFQFHKAIYSIIHMTLMSLQFAAMAVELALNFDDVAALTTNTITLLFFIHGPTKVFYFALRRHKFYKTICAWDTALTEWDGDDEQPEQQESDSVGKKTTWTSEDNEIPSILVGNDDTNSRVPLFIASSNFFKKDALRKMTSLLVSIMSGSAVAGAFWSVRPFLGLGHYGRASTRFMPRENASITFAENATFTPADDLMMDVNNRSQWNLIVDATYPWDTSTNPAYTLTLMYQLYWLVFCLAQINLPDLLFCSWLIFACEQIRHLKDILHPLMELSRIPRKTSISSNGKTEGVNKGMNGIFYQPSPFVTNSFPSAPSIYSVLQSSLERNVNRRVTGGGIFEAQQSILSPHQGRDMAGGPAGALQAIGKGMFRGDDAKIVIQKATKYWVEKHKYIVRFVEYIGDSYGMALLIHMLTSTITLTLLSYEATKISSVDMHALTVITYLFYTLGQVFLFCIYGNKLIEESTSVMQAAYDSPWYECTEEAKAFIQIVCQQSQRPMSVSGAKFFTVSLDLFASVLGAVVTYFMVLIQLK